MYVLEIWVISFVCVCVCFLCSESLFLLDNKITVCLKRFYLFSLMANMKDQYSSASFPVLDNKKK